MNINANEILLLAKKNIKFKGEAEPAPQNVAVAEPTASNPQAGLNALEAQGQNNISFQGVTLPASLTNKSAAMMATLLLASASLTSCIEDDDEPKVIEKEPIHIENTVIVDFSAITDMFNMMLNMWKDMVEQQKITNEQMILLNTQMADLMEMYKQDKISAEEFYNKMYEFMMNNEANQQAIISILVNSGKTQEEAKNYLADILAEVKAGKLDAAEAWEKLMKELGDIKDIITVNMNQVKAMFEAMQKQWQEMNNNHEISNSELTELNKQVSELIAKYEAGQISAKDFYAKMFEYMETNEAHQLAIINIMKNNGKSEEEAVAFLEKILAEVQSGKLDAADAWNKILGELGNINSSLDEIKEQIKYIQKEMVNNHKLYMAAKEEELKLLAGLYEQGKINKEQLDKLIENTNDMRNNLETLKGNSHEIIAILKDETKFNELKDLLKGLGSNDVDYEKFEQMFKIYGLSIENVIGMSADQIEAAIKTLIDRETEQTEQLVNINTKIDMLNMFPGFDSEGIEEALAALEKAINNNTTEVTGELGDIQAQLDKVLASLDNIFNQIGKLSSEVSTSNKLFAQNWEKALAKLDGISGDLADIKKAQKVSNQYLTNIDNNTKGLKEAQNLANAYLAALLDKVGNLEDMIANLEAESNGGMTIDQFAAFMKDRDEAQFNKFVKFTQDMGFDKLPGDVATIKDLLGAMNDKIQNLKDYSGQLETIIAKLDKLADFLKNADFSNPDYTAKLDKIIDLIEKIDFTLECNCEHTCNCEKENIENNEGIVGDLEDIFG